MDTILKKKVWTKSQITEKLKTSDKAVIRGLIVLYSYQTAEEKLLKGTKENNGVGFNAHDAEFMCSVAEQIISTRKCTVKQLEAVRKGLMKYAGQLTRIANDEQ